MKAPLNIQVTVAIQHDEELRNYFKITEINEGRNKLILLIFSCLKSEKKI